MLEARSDGKPGSEKILLKVHGATNLLLEFSIQYMLKILFSDSSDTEVSNTAMCTQVKLKMRDY